MNLPMLFKLSSEGTLLQWAINVDGNVITTKYGQYGGAIQTATDFITKGKNVGKANATTPEEQAVAEATAKWTKQKKTKGYVESIEEAKAGARDASVEGGIDPMLAQKYKERAKYIKWPAYGQPKLDGIRCLGVVNGSKVSLWSRTRKPIKGVPHVIRELEQYVETYKVPDQTFDGELYNHAFKKDFEKIVSYVRQEVPQAGHEVVQYHMYDVAIAGLPFKDRAKTLEDMHYAVEDYTKSYDDPEAGKTLRCVETVLLQNEDEMLEYFADCLARGYEGCMVRNADGEYEFKRSNNLQKVKEMMDAEFKVVGVKEGRGKMAGKAIFECCDKEGRTFEAKMKGSLDNLVQYVKDPSLAIGRELTVQFQNFTAKGIPRFPVGIRFREAGL